jgi:drug/metabolite transporter (DMT)-like permease
MQTAEREENDSKELLFQYERLREEILHNDALAFQILGATIVLVTAIFGVIFSQAVFDAKGKGFLFAVADAVAIIGMFQGVDRQRSTFLIASYLRHFIEPHMSHVRWETRLLRFRQLSSRKSGYGATLGYELITYFVLVIACLVLGIVFTWFDYFGNPEFVSSMLFWVVVLIVSAWFIYRAWVNQNECVIGHYKTFDPVWDKIEDEEKGKSKSK